MFMEQGIPIKFLIAQNHGRISQLPPVVPKDNEEQEKERGRMKAICNGRLVMHDRILEGQALLFDVKKSSGLYRRSSCRPTASASTCRALW